MSESFFHNNAKYVGKLNMFGQEFNYTFELLTAANGKLTFRHEIEVPSMNMVVDVKEGEGENEKIDENIFKLKYNDPETEFEADLNVNTAEMRGICRQLHGLFSGSDGTLELKYLKK
jgi:hypothetical protein